MQNHSFTAFRPGAYALIAFWLIVLSITVAHADATYTWEAPTTREGGDPLPPAEIAGYLFEYSVNGTAQASVMVTGLTHTVTANGKVCATATTVDTDGNQSVPSDVVCKKGRPNKPGNFKVR